MTEPLSRVTLHPAGRARIGDDVVERTFRLKTHTPNDTWTWVTAFMVAILVTLLVTAYLVAFFLKYGNPEHYGIGDDRAPYEVSLGIVFVVFAFLLFMTLKRLLVVYTKIYRTPTRELLEQLGASRVDPRATDLRLQRLVNICEEIAVASGHPAPTVYVMEDEDGINAFTAGLEPWNAAVCVTAGALRYLKREELQAVIAHEYGHVTSGDVHNNMIFLNMLGSVAPITRDENRPRSGRWLLGMIVALLILIPLMTHVPGFTFLAPVVFVLLVGVVFMIPALIVGKTWSIGVLAARLAHAGFGRRRELEADALAVQFTRNPIALANVLRKIGGLEDGAVLHSDGVAAFSHMCIAPALAGWSAGALATHPPLAERLKQLGFPLSAEERSGFDEFDPSIRPRYAAEVDDELGLMHLSQAPGRPQTTVNDAGQHERARSKTLRVDALRALETSPDLDYAAKLLAEIPNDLRAALRTLDGARAAAFALLGESESEAAPREADPLERSFGEFLSRRDGIFRLPVLELAMPTLLGVPAADKRAFCEALNRRTRVDSKITSQELTYLILLTRPFAEPSQATADNVSRSATIVIAYVAYAFAGADHQVKIAFEAGLREAKAHGELPERSSITFDVLSKALARLAELPPLEKPRFTRAVAAAVAADGKISIAELEFVRAVGAALDCPIPPLNLTK